MCTHSVLREDNQGPGGDAEEQRLLLTSLESFRSWRASFLTQWHSPWESHGEWGVLEGRHWAGGRVVVGAGPGPLSGRRDDWLGILQLPQSKPLPVPLLYLPSPHLSQPVGRDPHYYILSSSG